MKYVLTNLFILANFAMPYTLLASDIVVAENAVLSGSLSVNIQTLWFDSCTPSIRYITASKDTLNIIASPNLGLSVCFSMFTPYSRSLSEIFIPQYTNMETGPIDFNYISANYLQFNSEFLPILTTQANVEVGTRSERFIYRLKDDGNLEWSQRSNYRSFRIQSSLGARVIRAGLDGRYFTMHNELNNMSNTVFSVGMVDPFLLKILKFNHTPNTEELNQFIETINSDSICQTTITQSIVCSAFKQGSENSTTIVVDEAVHSLARSMRDNIIFASLPNSNRIHVINALSGVIEQSIDVGGTPGLMHTTPNSRWLAVSNSDDNSISIIDTLSEQLVGEVFLNEALRGITASADSEKFYLWTEMGRVLEVSINSSTITHSLQLSNNLVGLTVDLENHELLAFTNTGNQTRLDIIDPASFEVSETQMMDGTTLSVPEYVSPVYLFPNGFFGLGPISIPTLNPMGLLLLIFGLVIIAARYYAPLRN